MTAKKIEILASIAKKLHDVAVLSDVRAIDYDRLESLTSKYLNTWVEGSHEGDAVIQRDKKFNKLALEYYEIKKQLDEVLGGREEPTLAPA